MRLRFWNAALAALALTVTSCTDGPTAPAPLEPMGSPLPLSAVTMPAVRISEIHYDNEGTDAGEAIEISGPAGTSLVGWRLALYNGSPTQRSTYTTTNLTGTIPATCGARGVVVITYPANGIQNGGSTATTSPEPDGVALVNPANEVVEFLSWEGSFVAASGLAAGRTSTDIGVRQLGNAAEGDSTSIKRDAAGAWAVSAPRSFGSCNDAGEQPPVDVAAVVVTPEAATVTAGSTLQLSAEARDASGAAIPGATIAWSSLDAGVATVSTTGLATAVSTGSARIVATAPNGVLATVALTVVPPAGLPDIRFSEIHYDNGNVDANEAIEIEGPAGASVEGWRVVLYNGNGGVVYDTRTLSGTIPATCGTRGVITLNYPTDGIQNGAPDGFALIDAAGAIVEFLSYEGTVTATDGPATGASSTDIGVAEANTSSASESIQRNDAGTWLAPAAASFGRCNRDGAPPPSNSVRITGRSSSDPLPVGFEAQLFASLRSPGDVFIPSSITWSSDTPALASVDAAGFVRTLAAGDAVLRATAEDGTSGTFTLRIVPAMLSSSAQYANHLEFGTPVDGNAGDEHLVAYGSFTASYDPARNIPNWVSYNLEATHFGSQDRCNCFSFDPNLPASFARYTTADYTNSSTPEFAIDRGHLVRSADRGAGLYDNATTFYLTNIIPQARDKNQGPWGDMENVIAARARDESKEVWVIAGATGSRGTVKNAGLITIPEFTWKVVVIAPRNTGIANVDDYSDAELMAVVMPNEPGGSGDWRSYQVTVDSIEVALESGTRPPVAAVGGPYTTLEGSALTVSAAASSDPDAGQTLGYAWSFGDGTTASGVSPSHTWAQDGRYTVRVIVTDPLGLADTATTVVTVQNVAPAVGAIAGATLLPGETYTASGSFADPGADEWTATVDYGDGSGERPLALAGNTFALSHRYTGAGTHTVTVRLSDDDATVVRTATVRVLTAGEAVGTALTLVEQLVAAGTLSNGEAQSLSAKLLAAQRSILRSATDATLGQLGALLNELDAMSQSGRLSSANAAQLRTLVERIVRSLGT